MTVTQDPKTRRAIFTEERVILDNMMVVNCDLVKCTLVYSGGVAPSFSGVGMSDCEFEFNDAASNTLDFLREMRRLWGDQFIDMVLGPKASAGDAR